MSVGVPMMKIRLNGEERETEAAGVAALLDELGLAGVPVLVELNGVALFPREMAGAALADGDVVEVVRLAAGG